MDQRALTHLHVRQGALKNLPWRVCLFVKGVKRCFWKRVIRMVVWYVSFLYIHESLVFNPSPYSPYASLLFMFRSCHIESHTHLQRKPRHLKISAFLFQMRWNPPATSVTVVWQMTIVRCRWSATIVRWFIVWYAFVAVLQWLLQMFWCKWRNRPFHRRMNRVKGSGAKLYVYAYIRTRE